MFLENLSILYIFLLKDIEVLLKMSFKKWSIQNN